MLHEVILAEGASSSDASLFGAIVSGACIVIAAVIGVFATRTAKHERQVYNPVEGLKKERDAAFKARDELDAHVTRLENICWENGINPHTGEKFRSPQRRPNHPGT